jgi:hypothetical protein
LTGNPPQCDDRSSGGIKRPRTDLKSERPDADRPVGANWKVMTSATDNHTGRKTAGGGSTTVISAPTSD